MTFEVNEDTARSSPTGSVARLGSVSLLGESAVDITPSATGHADSRWGYVPPGPAAAALADITDQASQGIS